MTNAEFLLPPRTTDQNGMLRRVGFELEFGGIEIHETASLLIQAFGGEIIHQSEYVQRLRTPLGDFQIEADSNFLKNRRYDQLMQNFGLNASDSMVARGVHSVVSSLAGDLIPFEVITPPLAITALEPVEKIRSVLCQNRATGTHSSVYRAFGLQFNPQVPDFSPSTILSYLRAFLLLYDWLYSESQIPLSRRLAPFIHGFPNAYVQYTLKPSYQPQLDELMDDYLTANPTRNRPLDLLPLFAHLDSDRVHSHPVEHDLVKNRPTFHYRLPNSQVDDANWSVSQEWNRWVEIERLANDSDRIHEMSLDYLSLHDNSLVFSRARWAERARTWLQ